MQRSPLPWLLALIALAFSMASVADARRSGGGFGGTRNHRSSPYRAPTYRTPTYRAPSYRTPSYRTPRYRPPAPRYSQRYRPSLNFFFFPFFGLGPFGFGGAAALLFNLLLLVVMIGFLVWAARRMRRR